MPCQKSLRTTGHLIFSHDSFPLLPQLSLGPESGVTTGSLSTSTSIHPPPSPMGESSLMPGNLEGSLLQQREALQGNTNSPLFSPSLAF